MREGIWIFPTPEELERLDHLIDFRRYECRGFGSW
jgi:hypothetical protein